MNTQTLVVVPAYNCEKQVNRVLEGLYAHIDHFSRLIVIDNQSTDNTLAAVQSWVPRFKNKLVARQNTQNFNLGGTLKIAFETAINENFEKLVIIHGDDQADFADLLPYLEISQNNKMPDLIIGARFNKESRLIGYSNFRKLGNLVLNKITAILFRTKVEDMIAGLNLFNVNFLKKLPFRNFPDDLTFDSNVLLWALSQEKKLLFIPITWKDEDQVSNAKVLSQAVRIMANLLMVRLQGSKFFNKDRSHRGNNFRYTWKDIS